MSDFINATVSFGVVISIKDKDKLEDLTKSVGELIMHDTEWTGEPKSSNGCIISMHPKEFQLTGKNNSGPVPFEQVELFPELAKKQEPTEPESDPDPIVKAVKKGNKLITNPLKITGALVEKEGYILVLQTPTGGMKSVPIENMVGQKVRTAGDKGGSFTLVVGKEPV